MAGGKASPRQKMINMMYLVLTALLALNVSADLLLSIQTIADSLRASADQLAHKNDDLNHAIRQAVEKEFGQGNRSHEGLLAQVEQIMHETDVAMKELEEHITELKKETIAGLDEEAKKADPNTQRLHKPDEAEANYRYWMIEAKGGKKGADTDNNKRGAGRAMLLRDRMEKYIDWANKMHIELLDKEEKEDPKATSAKRFDSLCLNPKDDKNVPAKSEHKNETWEYFTFHRSPAVANLAIMQKMKNDLLVVEANLLEKAKSKLKNVTFKIEKLILDDAPESRIVVLGEQFETRLFVTIAGGKEMNPTFGGPGKITKDKDGAKMQISTLGVKFGDNELEKEVQYTATATVPKATGGAEKLDFKKKYKVVKPVIQAMSAAVSIMYRGCGNEMQVGCPALEVSGKYDPAFSAKDEKGTQEKAIQSKTNKNKVMVVPKGNKCILEVTQKMGNETIVLGKLDYKVIDPPRPQLFVFVNGQPHDIKKPVSKTSKIEIKVIPDKEFAASLPNDAQYEITRFEILCQSGLGAPSECGKEKGTGVAKTPTFTTDIQKLWRDADKGNKLFIKIPDDGLFRVNFQKEKIPIKLNSTEQYFNFQVD